jgi:hypothetical protein
MVFWGKILVMPSESGEKYLFFIFLNDRFNSKDVKYGIPEFFCCLNGVAVPSNQLSTFITLINLG